MNADKPQKPIAPIHRLLIKSWISWLVYRIAIYPMVVAIFGGGVWWVGVLWQTAVLLPALIFHKAVWQGKSAYALLWASMVMLVYLGVVGVFLLMRFYEQAHAIITGAFLVEFLLLFAINALLFVLLKRLPPMHKTQLG